VLAVLTAPDVVVRHGSESAAAIVLHVALWVPIAFRRHAPELVFGVTAGIAFVQWLVNVPVAADAALQSTWSQKNRRTVNHTATGRPATGRSARCRR